jgi:hypothetical protein
MAIIPELVIQSVIAKGIKSVREDDYISDTLLYQLPQTAAQQLKKILRKVQVNIILGYPREMTKLPCVSILLRGEDESNSYLGDRIGQGYDPDVYSSAGDCNTPASNGTVTSTIPPEFFYPPHGQPDTDPVPEESPQRMMGQPRKIFPLSGANPDTLPNLLTREGGDFGTTCLVQIMTTHPELTLVLTAIVKYAVFRYKMDFEGQGMKNATQSATDFLPLPEYFPDFVYTRGVQLSFENDFSYVYMTPRDQIPSSFEINLNAKTANRDCSAADTTVIKASVSGLALAQIDPNQLLLGVPATITFSGVAIQNGAVAIFDDMPYVAVPLAGVQVLGTSYIHGNALQVDVVAWTTGTTSVTIRNPDYQKSTLHNALVVV